MNSITDPREIIAKFEQAKMNLEEFFNPHVDAWLEIQVTLGKLTKDEAGQTFSYDCTDPEGIWFASEDWEETWQYGGYERHCGREIAIPFEFFDDMQTFQDAAKAKKAAIDRINAEKEKLRRQKDLQDAEAQLERAQAALRRVL